MFINLQTNTKSSSDQLTADPLSETREAVQTQYEGIVSGARYIEKEQTVREAPPQIVSGGQGRKGRDWGTLDSIVYST